MENSKVVSGSSEMFQGNIPQKSFGLERFLDANPKPINLDKIASNEKRKAKREAKFIRAIQSIAPQFDKELEEVFESTLEADIPNPFELAGASEKLSHSSDSAKKKLKMVNYLLNKQKDKILSIYKSKTSRNITKAEMKLLDRQIYTDIGEVYPELKSTVEKEIQRIR